MFERLLIKKENEVMVLVDSCIRKVGKVGLRFNKVIIAALRGRDFPMHLATSKERFITTEKAI